jgi:DNA-binding CsgD family transcriptional regulator
MTVDGDENLVLLLKRISRLLGLVVTKGAATQRERIAILSDAGFEPKEIADLIGTTPNTVSVTLHSLRKQQTERTAGRGKKKA